MKLKPVRELILNIVIMLRTFKVRSKVTYSSLTPYFPLKESNVNRPVLNALERQENEHPVKKVGKEPYH